MKFRKSALELLLAVSCLLAIGVVDAGTNNSYLHPYQPSSQPQLGPLTNGGQQYWSWSSNNSVVNRKWSAFASIESNITNAIGGVVENVRRLEFNANVTVSGRSFSCGSGMTVRNYWNGDGVAKNVTWQGANFNNNNNGTVDIRSPGTFRQQTFTFTNAGALALAGFFTVGSGAFNSSGAVSGTGTFTNNNLFMVTGSSSFTPTLNNINFPNGSVTINSGVTFTKDTGTFTNSSLFFINGALSGNAALNNTQFITVTGTLGGTGTFFNQGGTVTINGGIYNRTGAFANTGTVLLNGSTFQSPVTMTGNTSTITINSATNLTGNTLTGTGAALLNFGGSGGVAATISAANFGTSINIPNIFIRNTGTNVTNTNAFRFITASTTLNLGAATSLTTNGPVNVGTLTNGGTINLSAATATLAASTVSNSGSFTTAANVTTTALFSNSNTLSVTSGLFSPYDFTNSSSATFSGASTFQPTNTSSNTGTINFTGISAVNGSVTNTGAGIINLSGTSHTISSNRTLTNNGASTQINVSVATTNSGTITNTPGTLNISNNLTDGTLNNSSTMNVTSAANVTGAGAFTNNIGGVMTHSSSGTMDKITITNDGNMTFNAGTLGSTGFTNTATGSTTFNSGATFSGTATSNSGSMTFNTGSTFSGTINAQSNSTITINGSTTLTGGTIAGAASNTGTSLIINNVTGTQSTAEPIADIRTVSVLNGTFNVLADDNIMGINTQFAIASGAVATIDATLSGTGSINNSGTLNFNTNAAVASFSALNMLSGATTNLLNDTLVLDGTSILGTTDINGNALTSNLNIGDGVGAPSSATLQTNSAINLITNIHVLSDGRLTLSSGATVDNFNAFVLDGTLNILNGASFTVSEGRSISGNGAVDNSGLFTVDEANLTLGGAFSNNATGIFSILGTPVITFGGSFTNAGTIFAVFTTDNDLPSINVTGTATLSNGTIVVGYNNNYIANGSYTLITTALSSPIGGYVLPQPSRYISAWGLTTNAPANTLVQVTVVRDGFGNHALTPKAVEIGNFLESFGRTANQSQLGLLNALEKIDNDEELTLALLSLLPPESTPIQTMYMISEGLRPAEIRLATVRDKLLAASYGENDDVGSHGVWIRPFGSSGHQRNKGALLGYKASTRGLAFGIDTEAYAWLTIGAAGSMSKSKVTQDFNTLTTADISTYQAMLYGTLKYKEDSYIDWIVAAGTNNYNATRNTSLPGFTSNAVSQYSGQQFTVKTIANRDFILWDYYQLTPRASAQYSFLRTLGYQESGDGAYDNVVNPSNMNLFRLGVGADFSTPFSAGNMLAIPAIHLGVYVDAAGGVQDTNTMFISGGPILTSRVQPGRLIYMVGASLKIATTDHFELMLNYNFEGRDSYTGQEVFLNLRYTF